EPVASIGGARLWGPGRPFSHGLLRAEGPGPTRTRTWNQGIRSTRRFPPGADYLSTLGAPLVRDGRVRDALACHQGHCSPQVVSAPSGGVPPAWLRIAAVRPCLETIGARPPLRVP